MTRFTRLRLAAAAAVAATLALSACGGDDDAFDSGGDADASGGASKSLTVGGATFTEMQIMEQIYGQLLTKAGFTVDYKSAENREIYAKSLESGEIDVVPEYAATFAEYLNGAKNGGTATLISTADAATTVSAAKPLAEEKGLEILDPAEAASQNAFFVTKKYADANGITTLSQLKAKKPSVKLAAAQECDLPERTFCAPGLRKVYGFEVSTENLELGYGTDATKQAVLKGEADLGQSGTTDGTLQQLGLVILEDDKKLQLADNLVPVVNKESAGTPEVAAALNALAPVLTTEDLAQLNLQVDGERKLPADVAKEFLTSKGLL